MNLADIREALAAQVRAAVDVSINTYSYMPSAPQYPCVAVVSAGDYVSYYETFTSVGAASVLLEILIVQTGPMESAGRFVDDMVSTGTGNSVFEAIDADKTLGGLVQSCICRNAIMAPFGLPNIPGYVARIPLAIVTFKESS